MHLRTHLVARRHQYTEGIRKLFESDFQMEPTEFSNEEVPREVVWLHVNKFCELDGFAFGHPVLRTNIMRHLQSIHLYVHCTLWLSINYEFYLSLKRDTASLPQTIEKWASHIVCKFPDYLKCQPVQYLQNHSLINPSQHGPCLYNLIVL